MFSTLRFGTMKIFSLVLVLSLLHEQSCLEESGDLHLVTVIHRHGARAPITGYKNDPYASTFYWPNGKGQLTSRGKAQMFRLGTYLRKTYGSFLGESYLPRTAYFRSTNTTRTLMSAQLVGVGLFPATAHQKWTNDTGLSSWSPIPVTTLPRTRDKLLSGYKVPCKAADEAFADFLQSSTFKNFTRRFQSLFQNLTNETKQKITALNFTRVYDSINSEMFHNLSAKQPKWVNEKLVNQLKAARNELATMRAPTQTLRKFYGGPLVKQIIENCYQKISNSSQIRFYDYSTHDKVVSILLSTLGAHNGLKSPYSAAIIVELRSRLKKNLTSESEFFLKFLYRNSSLKKPYELRVAGCRNYPCTLEDFVAATKSLIPKDYEQECDPLSSAAAYTRRLNVAIGMSMFVAVLYLCQ